MGTLLLKGWTLLALVVAAFLTWKAPPPVRVSHCASEPKRERGEVVVESSPNGASRDVVDHVLLRLAVSESSEELCELLEGLEPSENVEVTYAISDVLQRARLRSLRSCAAKALAMRPGSEATSFLIDLAQDSDLEIAAEAFSALLSRGGELTLSTVLDAAHDENPDVRLRAISALLAAHRAEAFELAVDLLPRLEDVSSASELSLALGELGDARALSLLVALVRNGEHELHLAAVQALGRLAAREAIPTLVSLLELGSELEFRAASEALQRIDAVQAVAALRSQAQSENAQRRAWAASFLASWRAEPSALEALRELSHSNEVALRRVAEEALGDSNEPGPEPAQAEAAPREVALQEALQRGGEEATLALRSTLPTLSSAALEAVVAERANERDPELRRTLVVGVAARGEPRFTSFLQSALRDEDSTTRRAAARGLIAAAAPNAEQLLDGLLKSDDAEDRSLAFSVLADRGDAASLERLESLTLATALDNQLEDSASSVGFDALKGVAPERAARVLEQFYGRVSPERQVVLLNSMDGLGRLAVPTCVRALKSRDAAVVEQAISVAANSGNPAFAPLLLEIARDEQRGRGLREQAAAAITSLGGAVARENQALLHELGSGSENETCSWEQS
ncbi:MAG: HEAT repeat domain-containing protein [Myxococcota bacterium]